MYIIQLGSVTQSCQTLRPHGLLDARLPCPSPTPGPCSDSRPSSQWCHPTISKVSILRHSAFFIDQLSHPYMTTGKTIALTRWTFVSKVMCLLFNMLSKLVIAFLPRSKYHLISWLQSLSAVILEPPQNKIHHHIHCFPIVAMKWWDQILVFWMLSFKPAFQFHQEAL